ncbi:MAG: putative membrane protein [Saprospiraceae bacterium]|jgi:putative membrane protein
MLWIKVFHLFAVISWMAGVMYLPRLFVYHAMAEDTIGIERFKVMERKLLFGIMTPSAIIAILFGTWLWLGYGFSGSWMIWKLALVVLLVVYHVWCINTYLVFKRDANTKGHKFYRVMNELPVLILLGILVMVVVKPF